MKSTFEDNANFGYIFAKMRNSIGHGHPKGLEEIHVFTYQLARCMIYTMILDKAGISHDIIKVIIQKILSNFNPKIHRRMLQSMYDGIMMPERTCR